MTQTLNGKQRRHLRALGHKLEPIVQIGKDGITPAFVAALDQALSDHELVKVKVGHNAPEARDDAALALAKQTRSHIAQILGGMILLYRADDEAPTIGLPGGKAPKVMRPPRAPRPKAKKAAASPEKRPAASAAQKKRLFKTGPKRKPTAQAKPAFRPQPPRPKAR